MSLHFDDRDRESVERDLQSADEEVRRLAVERADLLPPADAIPHLAECLGDPSWRVRKAAVERLVATGDTDAATDALIAALADGENSGRRNAAVEALIQSGARVVPRLLEATTSEDDDVRKLVVDTLAGLGDDRAMRPLIGMLADRDPNVRAAAADALGAIGGDDAVSALRQSATRAEEDQLVRFSALHALASLEVPLRARDIASVLEDPVLASAGLALLGRCDDEEGVAVLLKALAGSSRASREAAMRSLLQRLPLRDAESSDELAARIREAAAGSPALVDQAVERLAQADLSSRIVLIQFLGLVGAPSAVVPILLQARDEALAPVALATLEALDDVAERALEADWSQLDAEARRSAYRLLGATRGEAGATRLLAALEDGDGEHRAAAARSLGARRMREALAPLVRRLEVAALEDEIESEEEISAITEALIALAQDENGGDDDATARAIELLSSRLEGAVESVRLAIARVLGCIGRPEDTQLVSFLLKDPGARVRRAAVDALARLEPGTASEPVRLALADESPSVRIAAARALGSSENDEVIHDLRRLGEDEDATVRAAAVFAATRRFAGDAAEEHRRAVSEMVDKAFAEEAPVALAAVEALREVGGPDAARATRLLERPEPEVLVEAIRCIGAHGDPAAVLPLVSHRDWSVRAEAIHMLADRSVSAAVPPILRRLETEQDEFVRAAILHALKRLED